MANVELLKEKIKESGMSISFLTEKMGVGRETFYNRMNNPDFRASEIVSLTRILRLTKKNAILFFLIKMLKFNSLIKIRKQDREQYVFKKNL